MANKRFNLSKKKMTYNLIYNTFFIEEKNVFKLHNILFKFNIWFTFLVHGCWRKTFSFYKNMRSKWMLNYLFEVLKMILNFYFGLSANIHLYIFPLGNIYNMNFNIFWILKIQSINVYILCSYILYSKHFKKVHTWKWKYKWAKRV